MSPLHMKPALALLILSLAACTNETTPEGHVGYVYHVPLMLGQATYLESQVGPTSTGMSWRRYVINIDIRPKNYTEQFQILSRDNLSVGFEAHARISVRSDRVRELIEEYGAGVPLSAAVPSGEGGLPEWYINAVRQPYRTAVRDIVHNVEAYEVQSRTPEIAAQILERLQAEYEDSPISFETVSIGNLTYPEAINQEIQRKLAAEQDLERMVRERQIAEQEAAIMVTTARGRAAAQRIVNETLTPLYVQHEMLEGFRALSSSPRVTIVAAPTSSSGSAPVMLNVAGGG